MLTPVTPYMPAPEGPSPLPPTVPKALWLYDALCWSSIQPTIRLHQWARPICCPQCPRPCGPLLALVAPQVPPPVGMSPLPSAVPKALWLYVGPSNPKCLHQWERPLCRTWRTRPCDFMLVPVAPQMPPQLGASPRPPTMPKALWLYIGPNVTPSAYTSGIFPSAACGAQCPLALCWP